MHPPLTWTCDLTSEADTVRLGQTLAACLQPGDVIGLIGDLGVGKTRLVQAAAVALGTDPSAVNSPTFSLIQEYAGRIPLRHCDTYRLRDPDEFADLGLDELLAEDAVVLIEWADRVADYLPRERCDITLTATGPTARSATFCGHGRRGRELMAQVQADFTPSRIAPPG